MKYKKLFLKIFSALISVSMVISLSATASAVSNEKYIKIGDLNTDKKVDISDATTLQKYILDAEKLTQINTLSADFNGDEKINICDSTEIQKMLAGVDYNCFVVADNNYIVADGRCENISDDIKIEFTEEVNFRNLIFNYENEDEFKGMALIKSVDQFYSVFGYYSLDYNEEFFDKYALVIWLVFDWNWNNSYEIKNIGVSGNQLLVETYSRLPMWQSPMPAYWHIFYRINQSDIENVEKISRCGKSEMIYN